jgi:hypothetical protein
LELGYKLFEAIQAFRVESRIDSTLVLSSTLLLDADTSAIIPCESTRIKQDVPINIESLKCSISFISLFERVAPS